MTTIAPWLSVIDATAAVDFYRRAFGATNGELVEFGGVVEVAELFVDDAPFWGPARQRPAGRCRRGTRGADDDRGR